MGIYSIWRKKKSSFEVMWFPSGTTNNILYFLMLYSQNVFKFYKYRNKIAFKKKMSEEYDK